MVGQGNCCILRKARTRRPVPEDMSPDVSEPPRCSGGPPSAALLATSAPGRLLSTGLLSVLYFDVAGVRVGLFAVAGPDMQRLVKPEHLPGGTRWTDATATARGVVDTLRNRERVAAVVLIGHQQREADMALARAVPGIDLILGSHSHEKEGLRRVPGTDTYRVSPYQYLTYLSEVRLRFLAGRLVGVEGGLVKMDASRPEDPRTAAEVARLQAALVAERLPGLPAADPHSRGGPVRGAGGFRTQVLTARAALDVPAGGLRRWPLWPAHHLPGRDE
jgi:hypothetical protein